MDAASAIYLKISDNEIQFLSGKEDYDEGIRYLQETYQIPLILLTMGKDGSRAYYKEMRVERGGIPCKTIETTGAGDTFCGSVLNYVLEHDLDNLTEEQLGEMLSFANAAAAIVTTKKGRSARCRKKWKCYVYSDSKTAGGKGQAEKDRQTKAVKNIPKWSELKKHHFQRKKSVV